MLEDKNGQLTWGKGIDPVKLIEDGIAADIFIASVRASIDEHHHANRTGKDSRTWNMAYMSAEIQYLRMQ